MEEIGNGRKGDVQFMYLGLSCRTSVQPLITPFTGNVAGPRLVNLALVKLDQQYRSRGQLSVRYALGYSDEKNIFVGETVLHSAGMAAANHTQSVVANNVYALSPNRLNETTFQFARSLRDYRYNDPIGPMLLRPSSISGRQALFPLTSRTENRYQILDNFTWFKGRHSFKTGVDINRVNIDGVTDTNFHGTSRTATRVERPRANSR